MSRSDWPELDFVQVDAFADRPFAGNPAAVVVTERPVDEQLMQLVALEMNLSETAFLHPAGDVWALRWFTPAAEVDLCGHATLASAHALWESGVAAEGDEIVFESRGGVLRCSKPPGSLNAIAMDFPALVASPVDVPPGLEAALGASALAVWRTAFDLVVEVADADAVTALRPDFRALQAIDARGVIVTAAGPPGSGIDFVSRFFAPSFGVPEDPVTGSAHCALGPLWAARLGRNDLLAEQRSARGGRLTLTCRGDRVILTGSAVTVARGRIFPRGTPGNPSHNA